MKLTKKGSRSGPVHQSQATLLESELIKLRSEFRETLRVYAARVEIQLAEAVTTLQAAKSADEIPREHLHQMRDLMIMVRKRKVKPANGRRKDLRKIDTLVSDVHAFLPSNGAR